MPRGGEDGAGTEVRVTTRSSEGGGRSSLGRSEVRGGLACPGSVRPEATGRSGVGGTPGDWADKTCLLKPHESGSKRIYFFKRHKPVRAKKTKRR